MKNAKLESKNWAVRFVADLAGVGGPKKFYRVFLRHWEVFDELLKDGESWPNIADVLTKAGARHRRGQDINAAQLREYNSRRKREAIKAGSDATYDETREDAGVAQGKIAYANKSASKANYLQQNVSVERQKNPSRTIGPSRIDQRLKMITKTRHGKRLDLDE